MKLRTWAFVVSLALSGCALRRPERFDLVLQGGRVIDPASQLDAVRNIGISGGRIVTLSAEPLSGQRVIDVGGLVVAPGFIDLHQHEHTPEAYRLKAFDGVTTALELELGVIDIEGCARARRGQTPINFGAAANHSVIHAAALGAPAAPSARSGPGTLAVPVSGPATNDPATENQVARIADQIEDQLNAGALGIGLALEYMPGTTREEVVEVFRLAARRSQPVFVHVRSAGRLEPGSSIESLLEVIGAAAATGASVHILHVNSSCMAHSPSCLELVKTARVNGTDVTVEAYPYGVGASSLTSAQFNPGWRERRGLDYDDLELPATGQRLTERQFDSLRLETVPVSILIHMNPDEVVDQVVEDSIVMIASDGAYNHPRNAGSFSRVLARNVRERGTLSLLNAVSKMSFLPALRLEAATPAALLKGRLQPGADADIVVFDLTSIRDNATFQEPRLPSSGVRFLIVGGQLVIDGGQFVDSAAPGVLLAGGQTERRE